MRCLMGSGIGDLEWLKTGPEEGFDGLLNLVSLVSLQRLADFGLGWEARVDVGMGLELVDLEAALNADLA